MADISGNIIVLSEKFETRTTWVAFNGGRVTHMVEKQNVLITVGVCGRLVCQFTQVSTGCFQDEEGSTLPILKIFHLNQMDPKSNSPMLIRSIKIQHGNRPYPVSYFLISY